MSYEQIVVLVTLVGALALFVTQVVPLGVTGLGIIAALGLTGVLSAEQALHAFSSPAVVLVGSLYVVSASLIRTGVIGALEQQLLRWGHGSERRLLVITTLATAVVSALLNNTSVVVLMLPIVLAAARRLDIGPSRLLIPLSYASILGGTMTLIGTSTNVLVSDLTSGTFTIGFFDFLPMGATFCGVGLLYLWVIAPRLLPSRATVSSITQGRAFEYLTELRVPEGGRAEGLAAQRIEEQSSASIRLLRIVRGEAVIHRFEGEHLQAGDSLDLRGSPESIVALRAKLGLTARHDDAALTGTTFAEAVVTPGSVLIGRTLEEIALNQRAGVLALALQRRGAHLRHGFLELPLQVGDVILVQGTPENVESLGSSQGLILLTGVDETIALHRRAPLAVAILGSFVVLATFSSLSLPLLAVAAATACIATGCLSLARASREVNWSVLGLLAGAITLGLAIERAGLAASAARGVLDVTNRWGPHAVLAGIYFLTSFLTEFVSNSGAAALMVPIALATAGELPLAPPPFVFAVAYAASASFATPIGYQTNVFVLGPGGYRFSDFLRVGVPLQLLLWAYATVALPFFFPFS